MTRSRVCPDTESTGLSPASDALPGIAIISDTGVPLLNTLICPPDTFKACPSAVCWPGPATSVNGPGGTVTGACTASTWQQLPSVLTGQVISIALWQMPGPAGQCGST
ncbi:hypothetical protein FX392_19300 [Salmonella enterica]|nr:hypothetical protein [Salmonella enterica subsp. enterica]ECG8211733.1 hypothetical protein [Salmonella enterica]ECO9908521.1 hypothetical protein [Salmonella enterica]EEA3032308.1 hypothetical protein [Salmonella enterica]